MPLFKKNHNNTNDADFVDQQQTHEGMHHDNHGRFNDAGYADGYADGLGGQNRHGAGGMNNAANLEGGGQHHHQHNTHNDPTYPSSNAPGAGTGTGEFNEYGVGHHNANVGGGGMGAGPTGMAGGAGMGSGGGATGGMGGATAAHQPMAPRTDMHGNAVHPASQGHGSQRMEGKIERVVGTMIGSQSLKAKGQAKEQEANALKAQSAELGEAERLEQIALARRERAVAHGAHPDLGHLGGQNPGAGATNMNELGGGANYGVSGAGGAGSAARGGY